MWSVVSASIYRRILVSAKFNALLQICRKFANEKLQLGSRSIVGKLVQRWWLWCYIATHMFQARPYSHKTDNFFYFVTPLSSVVVIVADWIGLDCLWVAYVIFYRYVRHWMWSIARLIVAAIDNFIWYTLRNLNRVANIFVKFSARHGEFNLFWTEYRSM